MKDKLLNNRYVVMDRIAKGGMAEVHLAYDTQTKREVAIKHFPEARDISRIARASYQKELTSLRAMSHPNVISLIDDGVDSEGLPYLVIELMQHDLLQYRDVKGEPAFAGFDDFYKEIGAPLLSAIAYAHTRRITHRDVKPRNVLISREGIVKLADFGIARLKGCLSGMPTLRTFETKPFGPPELDDGEHSDSRDVFSFAAIIVWALSETAVTDYPSLFQAAADVPLPPNVRPILERALDPDPAKRFENAVLLQCELEGVMQSRLERVAGVRPQQVFLRLSRAAKEFCKRTFATSDSESAKLLTDDINESPTVSLYTAGGMPVPLEYVVVGAQYTYHIKFNEKDRVFAVVNIDAPPLALLQYRKDSQPPSPFQFRFSQLGQFVDSYKALDQLEECIRSYQASEQPEERNELVDKWRRVLQAKYDIEEQRLPPVDYSDLRVQSPFIVATVQNPEVFELGARWTIRVGRQFMNLEVARLNGDEIRFYARSSLNSLRPPVTGQLRFDIAAQRVSLDRQSDALEMLSSRTAVRPELLDCLTSPEAIEPPSLDSVEIEFAPDDLDQSKIEAIRTALGAKDLLLVHGPPGTGKTRMIAFLIDAIKRLGAAAGGGEPILLVSQTHVAIDNALEEVAKIAPGLKLLRISSTGQVADGVRKHLLDTQMHQWRDEVEKNSSEWIRRFALLHSVDPNEVETGCRILELAGLKKSLARLDSEIACLEEEVSRKQSRSQDDNLDLDRKLSQQQLAQLKDDRQEIGKELARAEKCVQKLLGDESISAHSATDVESLAQDFLQHTAAHGVVRKLMELRSDWLLRFGKGDSFNSAACERADVVAGTCIGFMGLRATEDVKFGWCIVDEASKATALETIAPLVRSKKWILVGDSKQLPPYSEFANSFTDICDGIGIAVDDLSASLFPQLEIALPEENQRRLRSQYRMCEPIAKLIAKCFYPDQLDPGSRPPDPKIKKLFGRSVVWIATGGAEGSSETPVKTSYVNNHELEIVQQAIGRIVREIGDDLSGKRILVLSPYSAQVSELRRALSRSLPVRFSSLIECATIDAVQGREADIVFFSLTRTRPTSFVDDAHRVNVALSRARELLVVVGDPKAFRGSEHLGRVLRYIEATPSDCRVQQQLLGTFI